uniref:Prohibitin n=1 Tax=Aegilops tauschii subsp. strangulata TaxID=200361 RepID=A0A453MFR9_AEGTS
MRVLPSIIHETLKAVVSQYNASQLITQREAVSREIRKILTVRLRISILLWMVCPLLVSVLVKSSLMLLKPNRLLHTKLSMPSSLLRRLSKTRKNQLSGHW